MKDVLFPGDEFRLRREELGLTIDDVFRRLRIPGRYVQALETGDLDSLPEPSYVMGFIKSYSRLLCLPEEAYVDAFRACTRPSPRFLSRDRSRKVQWPSWVGEIAAWAAVCAFLGLAWFAYTVVFHPNPQEANKLVEAGSIEMVVPPAPDSPEF